ASGSTRQTTTIVTPSPHAIVSAEVLLELARWCQQWLETREEHHLCHPVDSTPKSPPHTTSPPLAQAIPRWHELTQQLQNHVLSQLTTLLLQHLGHTAPRGTEVDEVLEQ